MKVVVTGATGNVGTSVMEALARSDEVDEAVGLARRRPAWTPAKASWVEVDVVDGDLERAFEGADVVIHLAWAIQPSRDEAALERTNVEGSRRVFAATAAAGVPKLVHASSVGAYAPGPKNGPVDESWPLGATPTSSYSRHKVAVERLLDAFEKAHPETAAVRMRPALIFKGDAANEIRRLFAGPFLPNFLLRSSLVPALPRLPALRFQAVHSADVGAAYARAALADVSGPFNLAAEPWLDSERLAGLLGVRTFPLPTALARWATDLTWRLRLQPTPPGWLDLALNAPIMSAARAREELGWRPRYSAVQALEELLRGMRRGRGHPTPPLEGDGVGTRLGELRTGVGARQWPPDREEQLVKYLADVHSIEEQALIQMKAAPRMAGDERLAEAFRRHEEETAGHERRIRERLEAHDAAPSKLKDVAGWGGGLGMALFARLQPETPGKLTAHAFSYEHMELAAHELLRRLAERAGDEETAAATREIGAEEQRMADRLAGLFDAAVDASLAASGADLGEEVVVHLADAHAIERQSERLLEAGIDAVDDEALAAAFEEHLDETRRHAELLERRLRARGASPSRLKDAALSIGGLNLSSFFGVQPDTTTKLAGFAYALEHLEIASYELLARVAARAGDEETVAEVERILAEERAAAARIAATWDRPGVPLGISG